MSSSAIRTFAAAALAAALAIPAPANAQEVGGPPNIFERMFGPRSSGQEPGSAPAPGSPTDQAVQIERLENMVRQLTGQVEQLQHRNRQLEAQVRQMDGGAQPQPGQPQLSGQPPQSSQLPRGAVAAPAGAAPLAPPRTAGAPPGRRSDAFDPHQNPSAPGAPRALGGGVADPPAVVTADPPVGAPGGRGVGAPLDLSTMATGMPQSSAEGIQQTSQGYPRQQAAIAGPLPPPPSRNLSATGAVPAVAPPSDAPNDHYDLAYGYVLRKDFALAEQSFETFLEKFPSDRRAADARFWLGESMFQRQRYDQAASTFLDVSTKHGSHPKAPDALLRLGQSLAALKQKEMACATFAEIGRKYPRATNSVKQGVTREQKRVGC